MKVLFVSSGNKGKISPIIINQAKSLIEVDKNLIIDFFLINKKGVFGYLLNLMHLKNKIKEINPDIIHAHYSFCGILSTLTLTNKPIITSLMGSDLLLFKVYKIINFLFTKYSWKVCIVKSLEMKKNLNLKNVNLIPNGVKLETFQFIDKIKSRNFLELPLEKKIILFGSDPNRKEKNYSLFKESIKIINDDQILIIPLTCIPNDLINYYYYSADLLVLTSLHEGSPNVIKEAMACNIPIISTDVGDVKNNITDVTSCYICKFDAIDLKEKILKALSFNSLTNGREKLVSLGLDSNSIANQIILLYQSCFKN